MKKMLFCCVAALFAAATVARADTSRPIPAEDLPETAQEFLRAHFPKARIAYTTVDRDFSDTTFEAVLDDGTKVEFHRDGTWKEVVCTRTEVPASVVPQQIAAYVRTHFPDDAIVKIDRDRRGWEIELSNGTEVTFNRRFRAVEIDD